MVWKLKENVKLERDPGNFDPLNGNWMVRTHTQGCDRFVPIPMEQWTGAFSPQWIELVLMKSNEESIINELPAVSVRGRSWCPTSQPVRQAPAPEFAFQIQFPFGSNMFPKQVSVWFFCIFVLNCHSIPKQALRYVNNRSTAENCEWCNLNSKTKSVLELVSYRNNWDIHANPYELQWLMLWKEHWASERRILDQCASEKPCYWYVHGRQTYCFRFNGPVVEYPMFDVQSLCCLCCKLWLLLLLLLLFPYGRCPSMNVRPAGHVMECTVACARAALDTAVRKHRVRIGDWPESLGPSRALVLACDVFNHLSNEYQWCHWQPVKPTRLTDRNAQTQDDSEHKQTTS